MKVLIPKYYWIGGMIDNMEKALRAAGHEVLTLPFNTKEKSSFKNPLNQLKKYNQYSHQKRIDDYNKRVREQAKEFKPDLVFYLNSGKLTPDTIRYFNESLKAKVVCFLPDNPFDSSRSKFTAMNFPWCHDILVCEGAWIPNIRNVAPDANIHKVIVGFNEEHFFEPKADSISEEDHEKFTCDVSFTGAGYAENAEGAYRSIILYHLHREFDVKFWSNDNWSFRFKYLKGLSQCYQGKRLSLEDLRKLYFLTHVNLNMPSPQIYSTFQPRVFEVAACGGFQIADYRSDLFDYFTEDELPVFKSIPELKDKIEYYKKNPGLKMASIQSLKSKVMEKHTWSVRLSEYFDLLNIEMNH